MTRKEIDSIRIEHRGEPRYWNITMFTVPLPGNSGKVPCYADLVKLAEVILRNDVGLDEEWYARNAEVMAWSDSIERGVLTPHRFRVTLDMVTKATEDNNGIANR